MTKTAVVTGGASGIGRQTVEQLLADGWTVWALDIAAQGLEELAGTISDKSRYRACVCDVGSADSIAAAFAQISGETDRIDALICCAGVALIGPLDEVPLEHVDKMIGVNIKGPWLCIRSALPLLRRNPEREGYTHAVIVGSIGAMRPKVGNGMYSATKAAVHVLAGVYAVELAPHGVLVNVVAPGTVDTPMIRGAVAAKKDIAGSRYNPSGQSPLGRIAQPDDISDVIRFLLTDAARYVNGAVIPVDGGSRAAFVAKGQAEMETSHE